MNIDTAQMLIIFFCVEKIKIQPFIHKKKRGGEVITIVMDWVLNTCKGLWLILTRKVFPDENGILEEIFEAKPQNA